MISLRARASALLALLVLALFPLGAAWSQVTVTAADPASTVQGTFSLDVTISGKGFNSSAAVKFLVSGTTDTGGITVRKVAVKGSTRIVATIDVTDSATLSKFDIEVTLSDGRKGKGTTLFTVQAKLANNDPCAAPEIDFPAFIYWVSNPSSNRQLYVTDAMAKCSRLVLETAGLGNGGRGEFSYPIAGTTDVGRVIWTEGYVVYGLTFKVTGTSIAVGTRTLIHDGTASTLGQTQLSKDGMTVYAKLGSDDGSGTNRLIGIDLGGGTSWNIGVFDAATTDVGDLTPNEDGSLFIRIYDSTLDYDHQIQLFRLAPGCRDVTCAVVVPAAPAQVREMSFVAASMTDDGLVYSDRLDGYVNCWLLQVVPDTGGSNVMSGQPRYGIQSTWYGGKILTLGIKSPTRRGVCEDTGVITMIDPLTSAETPLIKGSNPEGR